MRNILGGHRQNNIGSKQNFLHSIIKQIKRTYDLSEGKTVVKLNAVLHIASYAS